MDQIVMLRKELHKLANPEKSKVLQRFFKTGKGEYGAGDVFLGITVPQSRRIAIEYKHLSFVDTKALLKSKIHEERLIAILILVHNFNFHKPHSRGGRMDSSGVNKRKKIYNFYLSNTKYINNWDLVDLSADKIVGAYLYHNLGEKQVSPLQILEQLAKSDNIWERRIAVIATYYFIKNNQYEETIKIAEILLHDKHDLIQKAVGWMLREVGKRDLTYEEKFLQKHYKTMPRTALRYAIEKFPPKLRDKYLGRYILEQIHLRVV